MKACTFFGHRDAKETIEPILKSTILHLIEKEQVDIFYVGNNGCFDLIVQKTLNSLKPVYPNINYFVVFAYPNENGDVTNAIYPLSLNLSASAIPLRNRWMIQRSDFVITYVTKIFGGAVKYKKQAIAEGKTVIELSGLCK